MAGEFWSLSNKKVRIWVDPAPKVVGRSFPPVPYVVSFGNEKIPGLIQSNERSRYWPKVQ